MKFFGSKDIKTYVNKYIKDHQDVLNKKVIIDVPAGTGISSNMLYAAGASVEAFDLFPPLFKSETLLCKKVTLGETLPINANYADYVLCQEGIEHVSDQLFTFREFNRILKKDGTLLLTTPNYSNLKSKLSYLLNESEYFNKFMPPNEVDSIWMSSDNELYLGHIFLLGIQRLRVLGKLTGFRIKKIHSVRINKTSLLFFPFIYPFIFITNIITYCKVLSKHDNLKTTKRKEIYKEIINLNLNIKLLVDAHLFIEFEKECELNEVNVVDNKYSTFDIVT